MNKTRFFSINLLFLLAFLTGCDFKFTDKKADANRPVGDQPPQQRVPDPNKPLEIEDVLASAYKLANETHPDIPSSIKEFIETSEKVIKTKADAKKLLKTPYKDEYYINSLLALGPNLTYSTVIEIERVLNLSDDIEAKAALERASAKISYPFAAIFKTPFEAEMIDIFLSYEIDPSKLSSELFDKFFKKIFLDQTKVKSAYNAILDKNNLKQWFGHLFKDDELIWFRDIYKPLSLNDQKLLKGIFLKEAVILAKEKALTTSNHVAQEALVKRLKNLISLQNSSADFEITDKYILNNNEENIITIFLDSLNGSDFNDLKISALIKEIKEDFYNKYQLSLAPNWNNFISKALDIAKSNISGPNKELKAKKLLGYKFDSKDLIRMASDSLSDTAVIKDMLEQYMLMGGFINNLIYDHIDDKYFLHQLISNFAFDQNIKDIINTILNLSFV